MPPNVELSTRSSGRCGCQKEGFERLGASAESDADSAGKAAGVRGALDPVGAAPLTLPLPCASTSRVGTCYSPVSSKNVVAAGRVSGGVTDEDTVWLVLGLRAVDVAEDPLV
jgi:hypothetical protein